MASRRKPQTQLYASCIFPPLTKDRNSKTNLFPSLTFYFNDKQSKAAIDKENCKGQKLCQLQKIGKAKNNVLLGHGSDNKRGTQTGKEGFVRTGGSLELFTV